MLKKESVEKALYEMEACFNGKGNAYVTDLIMYIENNGGLPIKWTGGYYSVAVLRAVSPAAVERSIRSFISKVRTTSKNRSAVERYLGERNICISETIGRFYTVLKAESTDDEDDLCDVMSITDYINADSIMRKGGGSMNDHETKLLWKQLIKELDGIRREIKEISAKLNSRYDTLETTPCADLTDEGANVK